MRTPFYLALCILSQILISGSAHADLGEKIEKLPSKTYCINASLDVSWQTSIDVLQEMGIETTLADHIDHVIATNFVEADPARLRRITSNPRLFKHGRFTVKIGFEEITSSFTKVHITLQARQNKIKKGKERLLKSRGTFEKFLAYRINQLAISRQFPGLYELRLGFDLVPDLESNLYRISHVQGYSPAGEAGFEDGDWLLGINGNPVSLEGELFDALLDERKEKQLDFLIRRKKEQLTLSLWVLQVKQSEKKIGMHLAWDNDAHEFWISAVEPDSPAEKAGFLINDVILKEAGIPLTSWTNYYRALARDQNEAKIDFEIKRNDQILSLAV